MEKKKGVVVTEEMLEEGVYEGLMHSECPICGSELTMEPDAQDVYCFGCDELILVINSYC